MNTEQNTVIGRLAPSPTGYLHMGNAWSFLIAWLSARLAGGKIFLRIEDIDPARSKAEFIDAILEDFQWLGIDYDGEIMYQSQRFGIYQEYVQKLSALTYPCYCSRKELREMAGAPQVRTPSDRLIMPDMGAVYSRTCRFLTKEEQKTLQAQGKNACLRLKCPPFEYQEKIPQDFLSPDFSFDDLVQGKQLFNLNDCGGDFALQRSDKVWAYQLAVSIDDALMNINQVVRGMDILTSTPRQLYLFKLLDYPAPDYAHIPLLLDDKGERLAKRHESLSLKTIRQKEKSPAKLLQYLCQFLQIRADIENAGELLEFLRQSNITEFPWERLAEHSQGIITNYQD